MWPLSRRLRAACSLQEQATSREGRHPPSSRGFRGLEQGFPPGALPPHLPRRHNRRPGEAPARGRGHPHPRGTGLPPARRPPPQAQRAAPAVAPAPKAHRGRMSSWSLSSAGIRASAFRFADMVAWAPPAPVPPPAFRFRRACACGGTERPGCGSVRAGGGEGPTASGARALSEEASARLLRSLRCRRRRWEEGADTKRPPVGGGGERANGRLLPPAATGAALLPSASPLGFGLSPFCGKRVYRFIIDRVIVWG